MSAPTKTLDPKKVAAASLFMQIQPGEIYETRNGVLHVVARRSRRCLYFEDGGYIWFGRATGIGPAEAESYLAAAGWGRDHA